MQSTDNDFLIKKENFGEVVEIIKNLVQETSLSFIDENEVLRSDDIFEVMLAVRWEVQSTTEDGNGDIDHIHFIGERLGSDLSIFEAIAPFVEEDSYIQMVGDDASIWRWVFDGRTCIKKKAEIGWE